MGFQQEQLWQGGTLALLSVVVGYYLGLFRFPHSAQKREESPIGWGVLLGSLITYLASMMALGIMMWGWFLFSRGHSETEFVLSQREMQWFNSLAGAFLALACACFLLGVSPHQRACIWKEAGTQNIFFQVAMGAGAYLFALPWVMVTVVAVEMGLEFWGLLGGEEQAALSHLRSVADDPLLSGLMAFSLVVFVPFVEELFFRGVVQNVLRKYFHAFPALLIGAAIFSAAHFALAQGWRNVLFLSVLFVLALILGGLYERQRCLVGPIILHGMFNGATVYMLLTGQA